MSKMGKMMMATLMMAAAAGMAPGVYDTGLYDTGVGEDPWKDESDEERKRRLHSLNPVDRSERERIMAHDKKTALKIYANRHPEAKGKKRKKK